MRELTSTLAKLQKAEKSTKFLTDVNNDAKVKMIIVNEDETVDIDSTNLIQELRELNSRREEILKLLMDNSND